MPTGVFQRAWRTAGVAFLLAMGAALRYPGGTPLNRTTARYSMSQNFLSDLGMTVAYNGEPNRLGAALFVASLLLLVFGLGSCVVAIARLHRSDAASRPWVRGAAVCTLLACAAFVGVAVTPENRAMALHVSFTRWGWNLIPLISALMALAASRSAVFPRRVAFIWSAVAVLLWGYAALLMWGPAVTSTSGLLVQVLAQKVATVIVIVGVVHLAREAGADRARASI
jgi:hypothetical membrane protein